MGDKMLAVLFLLYIVPLLTISCYNVEIALNHAKENNKDLATRHMQAAKRAFAWPVYAIILVSDKIKRTMDLNKKIKDWEKESENNDE